MASEPFENDVDAGDQRIDKRIFRHREDADLDHLTERHVAQLDRGGLGGW